MIPLFEKTVATGGCPYTPILVFGEARDAGSRANLEVPQEVLCCSLISAESPAGTHIDGVVCGTQEGGNLVAGYGIRLVGRILIVALLAGERIKYNNTLMTGSYPQVVSVCHQYAHFLYIASHGIVVDELRLRVVDTQTVLMTYPDAASGHLANGIDHTAIGS